MKAIKRMMTNICSDHLIQSKLFYTNLFDFKVNFDSDWFVHLVSEDENVELGIVSRTHEIVPSGFQQVPQGVYLTFVVDNVDEVCALATKEGMEIVSQPEDTFYGQRRLLLKDPDGTLVDVSSPMAKRPA